MLNQVVLVGRLVYDPVIKTLDDGRKVMKITLAIKRGYKNAETNEYDTDFIVCTLWEGIAESTVEYCKKGATIGVKARLAQRYFKYGDNKTFSYPEIVAEKITFINTKNNYDD
jgi:single-strand DNA-binding protein